MPVLSSAAFALQEGEILNHGSRSLLEFFILEHILNYCIKHDSTMIPNDIEIIYNAVVELYVPIKKTKYIITGENKYVYKRT